MKNPSLVCLCVIVIVNFSNCNKQRKASSDSEIVMKSISDLEVLKNKKHINQALLSLDKAEGLARGGVHDSLRLDSAVWALEVSLNYKFDYYDSRWDTSAFVLLPKEYSTISVPINTITNKSSYDDLQLAFSEITVKMKKMLTQKKKIYSVNVEGYLEDIQNNRAIFLIETLPVDAEKFWSPCLCYDYMGIMDMEQLITNSSWACSCPKSNINAGQALTNMINCQWNPCGALGGGASFWFNIVPTVTFSAQQYPNFLFMRGPYNCTTWCGNTAINQINCATLFPYKANYVSLANANIPPNNVGLTVKNKAINSITLIGGNNFTVRWDLLVEYGTRNCALPISGVLILFTN